MTEIDVGASTLVEEITSLVDTFDSSIAPQKVFRNNNNKLYLILKAFAAGLNKMRNVVLALKYKFDPRYCSEDDLLSTMKIVGETIVGGKSSIMRAVATNTNEEVSVVFFAGEYVYISADGQPFRCSIPADMTIAPLDFEVLLFTSQDFGSWIVQGERSALISASDGSEISQYIEFEVLDNKDSLGRNAESMAEVRQRLLTDTTRQDSLRELELALQALPSIFACNVIFNPANSGNVTLEDGTVLLPKELLLVVTGAPDADFAETVCSKTFYKTHMNTPEEVVYYHNDLLVGGKYPVYFMYHKKKQFYLTINYKYSVEENSQRNIENQMNDILREYRYATQHISAITEPLLYKEFDAHTITSVEIKKIYIQEMHNGALISVAQVDVPKLMIPELAGVTFIAEELDGRQ